MVPKEDFTVDVSAQVELLAKTKKREEPRHLSCPFFRAWPAAATSTRAKECSDVHDQGFASAHGTTEPKPSIIVYE